MINETFTGSMALVLDKQRSGLAGPKAQIMVFPTALDFACERECPFYLFIDIEKYCCIFILLRFSPFKSLCPAVNL